MFVCLFHHGSTRMARHATLLALFTLSSLRSTYGRSLGNKGATANKAAELQGRVARSGGRAAARGTAASDVFIFADGRRLSDDVCPTDCMKCSGIGECLHCTNSKYLNPVKWTCEEVCPDGYYPDGTGTSNRTCTQCASDCAKCFSAAECVQCKNNKHLSPTGSCGVSCPPGYQKHGEDSTGGTCWPCPPKCRTCSDWYICDVCEPGAYLLPNRTCLDSCDDGYYKDDSGATEDTGGVCTECYETCSKCSGRETCSECQQHTYLSRVDYMCRSTCEDGFYQKGVAEVGNTCEACPGSCSLCSSAEKCSACTEGFFLTPNETCDESCPDGYYGNSSLGSCESCPAFCDRCSDANTCMDCMKSRTLTAAATCDFVCPEGFYKNGTGTIGDSCQRCPSGCGRCIAGMFSPVVCLECVDYNFLTHRGECVKICPEGYYPEAGDGPIGGMCKTCDPTCVACRSQLECTKCKVLHFLTPEAKCELDCPRGWTEKGGMDLQNPGVCVPCADNCAACHSLEVCQVCTNFNYLHQGSCARSCPVRFFELNTAKWEKEGRLCSVCRENDYECSAPNALVGQQREEMTIQAQSCQNDYYLDDKECVQKEKCPVGTWPRRGSEGAQDPGNFIGGVCEECPYNCEACSSPVRCTSCRRNTYLSPEMFCEERCPVGFFEQGTAETKRSCQPCSTNCSACESSAFCTQCTNGAYLTEDFTCEPSCPEGFYPRHPPDGSSDGRTCEKCLGDCLTCETRYSCTKCKNSAYLTHKKECLPECPATHYPDGSDEDEGRFCIECLGTCSECSGPYNCTQCKTPTFLTSHASCESSCPEGYYMEVGRDVHNYWGLKVGGLCKSCPENCNRCLGSGCMECNKFTYLDSNGECVERCPDGYFGRGTAELGRVCAPCSASHGLCLNTSYVLECGENTYLDPWNITCVQTCPDGYFGLDGESKEGGPKIGGTCEKCLGTCKKCSSSVVCEVCWDGTFLNPRTGRCAMECPSDHYMVGFGVEGRICKPCPLEAAGCVNETWFFECRGDNQYLAVGGGTCTTKCPDGYFGRPGVQLEEDGPLIGGTCEKCVGNCQRCKSAKECLQCKGGTYFDPISFKCSFECPSDHFMVGIGDMGRECKPCPQLFGACVNETFATQCRGDQQYLVPAGGACSSSCPAGFFGRPGVVMSEEEPLIGGTCEQCIAPCETCFSATECKTCKGGTYLNPYDHGCRFDCPPDTFMSGTGANGRTCELCPSPFYACLNTTYATACHGDNAYLTPQHTCETECPDGYYKSDGVPLYEGGPLVGGSCQKCVDNCKSCHSMFQCTKCRNGAYFDAREQRCSFTCPEGHYMVGDGEEGRECVKCPYEFYACLSPQVGTECRGDNKYLTEGKCVSTCPDGQFRRPSSILGVDGFLIGGTCEKCVDDCQECVTHEKCLVCANTKLLLNGTCLSSCPDGYYPKVGKNGLGGSCEICADGALLCSPGLKGGEVVSTPVQCEEGYDLKKGECKNPCTAGTFKDAKTGKCTDCPDTCRECVNATKCTSCKTGSFLDMTELPAKLLNPG
ncbi:unnamed protein product [Effrenium voratum]|nr:unnamed protein product [Effrenium voratum]